VGIKKFDELFQNLSTYALNEVAEQITLSWNCDVEVSFFFLITIFHLFDFKMIFFKKNKQTNKHKKKKE